jgi:hypothetical protein
MLAKNGLITINSHHFLFHGRLNGYEESDAWPLELCISHNIWMISINKSIKHRTVSEYFYILRTVSTKVT